LQGAYTEVGTFLARPIEVKCPRVWLDATFHKVREAGRVVSVPTVIAIGVSTTGERTVLGAATGPSEDHQFSRTRSSVSSSSVG
jgi:putative transposase